jgi:flagellar protein FlbB
MRMPAFVYVFLGMAAVVGIYKIQRQSFASETDPRVKQKVAPEVSGLKATAPLSDEMIEALNKRDQEIADKERVQKEKEEFIAVEERRIRMRIEELTKVQDELDKSDKANRARSDELFKRMVKTYETMSPKKAAGVISVMKDDLAIDLLLTMKEKKVAAIFDVMDAQRAMKLSSLMARRKPAGRAVDDRQASPNEGGQALP